MANFDNIIKKYENYSGYTGNPPTTETEYNELFSEWTDKPTWAEIQSKVEIDIVQTNRAKEYPDIGDQLDDLFKAGAFSEEMTASLQAVKDKYPKE